MVKISNSETKKLEDLYKSNKLPELEKETKKLLKIEKNNLVLLNILGVIYLKKKLFIDAEETFKKILNINPNNDNALKNLAETYRRSQKIGNAIKYYELYLEKNSNDFAMANNLASCYLKNKKYKLAVSYYEKLIKKTPQNEEYLISLAFALIESLNLEKGIKILERVLDKNINNKRAYDGYLFFQNYNPKSNINKIDEYIKKFNKAYKKVDLNIVNFNFKKNPDKINLAFISPDFRIHPVGYAIRNVIKYLKNYNFNLFGYYNFKVEDTLTNELKNHFNKFYNISDLGDEEIINKIRSDGIHILIDLAGHTVNNNLTVFYYNPAPIQISWLGYLPTTGIKEIRYKIGDPYIYSKSSAKHFTENFLNLPNLWSDFAIDNNKYTLESSSEYRNDEIVFGCFVTLRKVNDSVIRLWSKVLNKFENTKIYFKAPELNDISIENNLKEKFIKNGISSNRLILKKSSDYKNYLESYLKVDISLDPFPWNGVTTSFESIWMGVPIFCLEGNSAYSRCTYSINKNLNMDDWIAKDENDYLIKLEKIIKNKEKLLSIKKELRKNAIKNNLFNSKNFTRDLANKLNQVWKDFTTG